MLLFAVFERSAAVQGYAPARAWPLRHAAILGPDELAVPGEVRFDRGLLRCERRADASSALAVQFPVDLAGVAEALNVPAAPGGPGPASALAPGGESLLTLRTCLLPQKTTPYLLSLELARHRLMLILNKLEEWALFDLPPDDAVWHAVDRTRQAFTAALLRQRAGAGPDGAWYSPEAEHAARQALALGVSAGELLARRHAQVQHARRLSGALAKAAAAPPPDNAITDHEARASRAAALGSPGVILPELPRLGCSINASAFTPELADQAAASCDFLSMPMRWIDMEPTEGKYAFARTDKWIEWAVTKARLPVQAGPLIELRAGCIPESLYIWEHDYETLRDVIIEHVRTLVTRYRRTVGAWNVCSGLPCTGGFALGYEQVIDLTRTAVLLVRKLAPGAKVIVEIAQPWGEYTGAPAGGPAASPAPGPAAGTRAIPPLLYADVLNQLGLNVDALGLRLQMGQNLPGRSTRDLMALSALLDRFAALDRPLAVTMLGAPDRPLSGPPGPDGLAPDPGHSEGPWSPATQAAWLAKAAAIACGKPYVQSVCWQDLYELALPAGPAAGQPAAAAPSLPGTDMPGGALLTINPSSGTATPKPAAAAWQSLRSALRARAALPGV